MHIWSAETNRDPEKDWMKKGGCLELERAKANNANAEKNKTKIT